MGTHIKYIDSVYIQQFVLRRLIYSYYLYNCSVLQALGIIVFVLLCGCLPFDDDSSRITSDVVIKKKFALRFPRWASNLSAPAKDLLTKLLDVDPKTRITAAEASKHPWVSGASVIPNNYLQSPNMLGGRQKREAPSPITPHMQTMHNKLVEANNECAVANAKAGNNKNKVKCLQSVQCNYGIYLLYFFYYRRNLQQGRKMSIMAKLVMVEKIIIT